MVMCNWKAVVLCVDSMYSIVKGTKGEHFCNCILLRWHLIPDTSKIVYETSTGMCEIVPLSVEISADSVSVNWQTFLNIYGKPAYEAQILPKVEIVVSFITKPKVTSNGITHQR